MGAAGTHTAGEWAEDIAQTGHNPDGEIPRASPSHSVPRGPDRPVASGFVVQVRGKLTRRARRHARFVLNRTFMLFFLTGSLHGAVGKKEYAIYIDAGSSGSRAYVYRWEARTYGLSQLPPKMVRPERVVGHGNEGAKVSPGIGYYAKSDEFLRLLGPGTENNNGLDTLISFCRQRLHDEGVKTDEELAHIPLYLGATAGIRKMKLEERQKVMDKVREYFAGPNSPSPFLKNAAFVRVIAGEEEGVYGWLATNYLLDRLGSQNSYGILDVGGASVQVTYQIDGKDYLASTYEVRLSGRKGSGKGGTIGDVGDADRPGKVRLFTHSFLYFGQDESFLRIDANVLVLGGEEVEDLATTADSVISHPCLPAGFQRRWDLSAQRFLPQDWSQVADGVKFEGTSNFEACYDATKPSMLLPAEDEPCYEGEWPNKECRIGNRYFPPIPDEQKFIGVASVYYAHAFLKPLMEKNGFVEPWSIKAWKEGAKLLCGMDHEALRKYNTDSNLHMKEKFLGHYCMLAVYLHVLFSIGLGLPEDSKKVYPVDKLNGKEFDIGFGYMLEHANELPWKLDDRQQWEYSTAHFLPLAWSAVLFGFFGSVAGGCLLIACRQRIEAYFDPRYNRKERLLNGGTSTCEGLEMSRWSVSGTRPSMPKPQGVLV